MRKIIFLMLIFFVFDISHIDSNSFKNLNYSLNEMYSKKYYSIYFVDMYSDVLKDKLKIIDCDVFSYIIDDKKYYARDIDDLVNKFGGDLIKIDGINIFCDVYNLIKFKNISDIY